MNHWVFITGATGGLGKAFAVECASRGWNLFLTDLRQEALETFSGGLRNTYRVQVKHHACDLTDPVSRTSLYQAVWASHLRFYIAINVAGTDFEGPFYEQNRDQIRTIIRLNIEGTLDVTHAILEHRDPYSPFHIITVASLAAYYPMPIKATYAASKRFLLDFSLALREEVRPLGATVTVLCPGGLPTTPECLRAIEAQGLAGQLTTLNTGAVAALTLDAALKGRAVVIPGLFNRILQVLGGLLPASWLASMINLRWRSARQKQAHIQEAGNVVSTAIR
jgi:short-subunit dehydrogenase